MEGSSSKDSKKCTFCQRQFKCMNKHYSSCSEYQSVVNRCKQNNIFSRMQESEMKENIKIVPYAECSYCNKNETFVVIQDEGFLDQLTQYVCQKLEKKGKKIIKKKVKKIIKRKLVKLIAKLAGKSAAKKIPGVGLIWGLCEGTVQAFQGNFSGAFISVSKGALSTIPGAGTLLSAGLDLITLKYQIGDQVAQDIQADKSSNKDAELIYDDKIIACCFVRNNQ